MHNVGLHYSVALWQSNESMRYANMFTMLFLHFDIQWLSGVIADELKTEKKKVSLRLE
jgi:hypothetical protein